MKVLIFALIIPLFFSLNSAYGLEGVECPTGEVCITGNLAGTGDLADNAVEVFFHAKNLLGAIHELDMGLVVWAADTAGVELPPIVLTIVSTALLFGLALLIIRFFIKSLKHASIVAMVAVAAILIIPFAPVQPNFPSA